MSNFKPKYQFKTLMLHRLFIALLLLGQILFLILTIRYYAQLIWVARFFRLIGLVTALHLLTSDQPAAFKTSLVFLFLLFPLFGGVFYWIFHYQTTTVGFRRALDRVTKETSSAHALIPSPDENFASIAPESVKLIHYLNKVPGFPIRARTETAYFATGDKFMQSLLEEMKGANRYIFLEFFIIGEGIFWNSVLEILKEKVREGVDVRIIYDDLGSFVTLPPHYEKKLRSMGIKCERFNRFRPFLTSIQNNRDHRKIVSVDGRVAFTGGMNLADEYINQRIRFGHWKDAAIKLTGDGAWSFTVMFLQMWSFLTGKQEVCENYLPEEIHTPSNRPTGWVQPYTDSPMDRENVGEQVYLQMISNARNYLYVTTPYLAIDSNLLSALKLSAKSGVDVRIVTPYVPDKRLVHFTTRSYYPELLHHGVKIYEYEKGFIHSKNMVADDRMATVGTVNLDFRSLYLHFECGVCLYQTDSIPTIKEDFLNTLSDCREITMKDCKSNIFLRFCRAVCRLFAPMM